MRRQQPPTTLITHTHTHTLAHTYTHIHTHTPTYTHLHTLALAASPTQPDHWTPLPSVSLKNECAHTSPQHHPCLIVPLLHRYSSPGAPGRVAWAASDAIVSVGLTKGAYVLKEAAVARCAADGTCVTQVSSNRVVCDVIGAGAFSIEKSVTLRGCCCTQDTVYVWSASNVWVHDTSASEGTCLPLQTPLLAAHGNNYYTPSPRGVEAFSRSDPSLF